MRLGSFLLTFNSLMSVIVAEKTLSYFQLVLVQVRAFGFILYFLGSGSNGSVLYRQSSDILQRALLSS